MKIWLNTVAFAMFTAPAMADVPNVVTDIAPVHSIVARIMQDVGTPELIVPPAASPHDHAMRPSEAQSLSQADIVVWIGPNLTPWMHDTVEALAGDAVHLTLQDLGGQTLAFRDGASFEGHDHGDHGHEDEDGHDDAEGLDPHMWLDPENARHWAVLIAQALVQQDPENAEVYEKNAAQMTQELDDLQTDIATRLDGLSDRSFVVFHDAFHYFEARFDVEAAGAILASDAQAPSPRRLREMQQVIEDSGAVCVMTEPQFNPGIINAVAGGLRSQEIDPLGFDLPLGPQMYEQLLRNIADSFADCLVE